MKVYHPPVEVFYYSRESYKAGIVEHELDGGKVKVYDLEKTIADCFKFCNKVGMDVAPEAIKDYFAGSNPNVSLLMKYARINRVEKAMCPYLEAML